MKTKPENSVTPWVDPDDAPLLDDAFFKNADYRINDKVVTHAEAQAAIAQVIKRTRGPGKKPAKVVTPLRIPPDVLARWKASGAGWQTRMVAMLTSHAPAAKTR